LRSSPNNIGSVDPDTLKIPAPQGRNLQLAENAHSPFQAEPTHFRSPDQRRPQTKRLRSLGLVGESHSADLALVNWGRLTYLTPLSPSLMSRRRSKDALRHATKLPTEVNARISHLYSNGLIIGDRK